MSDVNDLLLLFSKVLLYISGCQMSMIFCYFSDTLNLSVNGREVTLHLYARYSYHHFITTCILNVPSVENMYVISLTYFMLSLSVCQ